MILITLLVQKKWSVVLQISNQGWGTAGLGDSLGPALDSGAVMISYSVTAPVMELFIETFSSIAL